jgi:predicted nucleic-acid-binding Zn-ribbon protein
MKLEMIPCIVCKKDMPKLRLEKYGYKNCINCSTTETYKAIITTGGEGDHTWNDIQILTDTQYKKYNQGEEKSKGKINNSLDNEDQDNNLQGPFTIITPED